MPEIEIYEMKEAVKKFNDSLVKSLKFHHAKCHNRYEIEPNKCSTKTMEMSKMKMCEWGVYALAYANFVGLSISVSSFTYFHDIIIGNVLFNIGFCVSTTVR